MSDDFIQANKAFELFTLPERARALSIFARLKFSSIEARFFEAVYQVIRERDAGLDQIRDSLLE